HLRDQLRHELASVATSPRAIRGLREEFDQNWVDRRIGQGLTVFFEHDLTFVVDASDRVLYTHFGRDNVDRGWFDLIRTELAPLTRERRGRAPERAPPTPGTIAKEIARVQMLAGRPALVAAALVAPRNPPFASAEDLAAPLAVTVKFIDDTVLHDIGA